MSAAQTLLSVGGLYETKARVHRPATIGETSAILADARLTGKRLTLIGAGRSFGRHSLPPDGADGLDTTALRGRVTLLEPTGDGLWVRAPGSHTFEQLWLDVRGYLPRHPPTGDRITVAGALASCAHNTSNFFARDVRAFRLLTPDGSRIDCREGAPGLAGDLFRCVPGSFGALGVIVDAEIHLRRVVARECAQIRVLERWPTAGHRTLDCLDRHHELGDYPLGLGVFYYGLDGPSLLLGDRWGSSGERSAPTLPLVDEATLRNAVLHGLANRAPSIAHRLQPVVLRKNRRFEATPYGFLYYQRSYERAHDLLGGDAWWARALRKFGVDPRLPVCHQTFVIPLPRARAFLDFYFAALREVPEAVARLELQDLVRLPACPWPLHGAYGMAGGCYLFSVSFSVRRDNGLAVVARLLDAVTCEAFARFGVRLLLLKQTHCDPAVLRLMHGPFLQRLEGLRDEVDPGRVLTSQLLESLGV